MPRRAWFPVGVPWRRGRGRGDRKKEEGTGGWIWGRDEGGIMGVVEGREKRWGRVKRMWEDEEREG